jgi:hypothetical protein
VLSISIKTRFSKKWINMVTKINSTAMAPIYTSIKMRPRKSLELKNSHKPTPKRKKINDKILEIRCGIKESTIENAKQKKSIIILCRITFRRIELPII